VAVEDNTCDSLLQLTICQQESITVGGQEQKITNGTMTLRTVKVIEPADEVLRLRIGASAAAAEEKSLKRITEESSPKRVKSIRKNNEGIVVKRRVFQSTDFGSKGLYKPTTTLGKEGKSLNDWVEKAHNQSILWRKSVEGAKLTETANI
jgi:predicted HicB family RNase H-like nuclease